jgi:Na+-transporting methylmalonyl-CoA/oxaloacetate decarboxylase gamma subunit
MFWLASGDDSCLCVFDGYVTGTSRLNCLGIGFMSAVVVLLALAVASVSAAAQSHAATKDQAQKHTSVRTSYI